MNPGLPHIKRPATLLLALIGIGIMVFYTYCDTACAYLQGNILGVNLQYIGIIFMTGIGFLAAVNKTAAVQSLLAAGLGGEIHLVWFQIREDIYCPYCLAFMICVAAAFAVNYQAPTMKGWRKIFYLPGEVRFSPNAKSRPLLLFMVAGYVFTVLTFSGSTLPVYAAEAEPGPRFYGRGKTEIRVYSDYFCPPCRRAEPEMEKCLLEIARKGKGRIIFIDTPVHRETVLYAKYFIYALCAGKDDIGSAVRIRRLLFEAAEKEIMTESGLADFLKARNVPVVQRDARPFFKTYSHYIQEDQIKSTPTLVVVTPAGKTVYSSDDEIIKAMKKIRGNTSGSNR